MRMLVLNHLFADARDHADFASCSRSNDGLCSNDEDEQKSQEQASDLNITASSRGQLENDSEPLYRAIHWTGDDIARRAGMVNIAGELKWEGSLQLERNQR